MASVMSVVLGENPLRRLEQAIDSLVLFARERTANAQLYVAREPDALPRRLRHLPFVRRCAHVGSRRRLPQPRHHRGIERVLLAFLRRWAPSALIATEHAAHVLE